MNHGRYRLLNLIYESEHGQQHLAEDEKLGREVVVSLLPPRPPLARWERIRRLTTVKHPHIAQIYDFKLDEGGVPLVVTEAATASVGVGSLPLPTAVSQFIHLADALAVAHQNGLTHGRVSPTSIRHHPHKTDLLWADWPLTTSLPDALPRDDVRQLVNLLRHTAVDIPPPLDAQLDTFLEQEEPTALGLARLLRTAVLPDSQPDPDPPPASETPLPTAPSFLSPSEPLPPPRLSLRLIPDLVTLTAGEATTCTADLVNEASIVIHVAPHVTGLPASWLTFEPPLLQLLPQEEAQLRLTITPPRSSEARAGQYAFELQALSVEHEGQVAATAVGQATVAPFVQVHTTPLQPAQLKNHGRVALTLHNQSNRAVTGQIKGLDQSGQLVLGGVPTSYTLQPDEHTAVDIEARPRRRPLLGTSERLSFEVQVTAEGDPLARHTAQLESRPYLPLWALPLTTVLLLFCCMASFFLYSSAQNRALAATARAEAIINEQNIAATLTRAAVEIILVQTPPTATFAPPTLIPTLTPRLIFSPTPSHTPTLEPTVAEDDTATPTIIPSPSLTPSATPALTDTVPFTPTATLTMTLTPEITATLTITDTPTLSVTVTVTPTGTGTVTPTATLETETDENRQGDEATVPLNTAVLTPLWLFYLEQNERVGHVADRLHAPSTEWVILTRDMAPKKTFNFSLGSYELF